MSNETKVISSVTIIDGTGAEAASDNTVIIKNGIIDWVGPKSQAPSVSAAEHIDLTGYTVLPGIIDTHVHFASSGVLNPASALHEPASLTTYRIVSNMERTLAAGVTSVRDLSGADYGAHLAVENGIVPGPRTICAIHSLGPTAGHSDFRTLSVPFGDYQGVERRIADDVTSARKLTRELIRVGAGAIKVMATGGVWSPRDAPEHVGLSLEEMQAVVEEAEKRGLKVAAHAQGSAGIKNAIRAGVHTIEHGYLIDDEGIELMLEKGSWLVPTLLTGTTPPDPKKATPYAFEKKTRVREQLIGNISKAFAAGVKVALGTDSGVVPHGQNLRELGLMVDLGLTPMQAIVAGTKEAAIVLGYQDSLGTIEVGKTADLIATKLNPLENIHGLGDPENIHYVFQAGSVVKQKK